MGQRQPGMVRAGFRRGGAAAGGGAAPVGGPGITVAGDPPAVSLAGLDLDDTIKRRVLALTGMAEFSYWSDPFINVASATSAWHDMNPTDLHPDSSTVGGAVNVASNTFRGGIILGMSTYIGADGNSSPSFFGQTGAGVPLYLFFRFRMNLVESGGFGFDANCTALFGGIDVASGLVMGVGSAYLHSGFFGAVGGTLEGHNYTVGVDSPVPFDFGAWHDGEIYTRAGKFWLKIDDCGAVDVSAIYTVARSACPIVYAMNGGATRPHMTVDHCAFAAPPNRSLSPVPA